MTPEPYTTGNVPSQDEPQLQQRLLHLATQLDQMQTQLTELISESQSGSSQIATLTRSLTDPQAAQGTHERLAELATQIESNSNQLEQLTQSVAGVPRGEQLETLGESVQQVASREQIDTLLERVNAIASQEDMLRLADTLNVALAELPRRQQLDEFTEQLATNESLGTMSAELKRLSRTQFKANALSESKEQQTASAIATLQEIATRREVISEARQNQERDALNAARSQGRGDLAADLLPALDGVELALANGRSLLARHAQAVQSWEAQRPTMAQPVREEPQGFFGRIFSSPPETYPSQPRTPQTPVADPRADEMSAALTAWLDGLALVRDRFLKLLAAEDVQLIPAEGQPFDPHLHVAVETATGTDAEPNTVVEVLRPGYRQGRRVLRYAEVIVSQSA